MRNFLKQRKTGSYIGGLLDTYARSGSIISAVQFMVVLIILYTTSVIPYIEQHNIGWFSFPLYIATAVVGVIILMSIVYIVVMPSAYDFFNRMVWEHNNPLRIKLEKMESDQKLIMAKLGILDEE